MTGERREGKERRGGDEEVAEDDFARTDARPARAFSARSLVQFLASIKK